MDIVGCVYGDALSSNIFIKVYWGRGDVQVPSYHIVFI